MTQQELGSLQKCEPDRQWIGRQQQAACESVDSLSHNRQKEDHRE